MYKRYFRKENPQCRPEETQWIEMTGREFYQFVRSPEGQGRYFIDMDDVVLEATEVEARSYKSEQNHRYYMQTQENDWSTLSLYAIEDESGCSGEEVVGDDTQAVEDEAILRIERRTLRIALEHLDAESYRLISALYFADVQRTERELAQELGISQNAVNKRKKKVLQELKFLVVKIEKSQQ